MPDANEQGGLDSGLDAERDSEPPSLPWGVQALLDTPILEMGPQSCLTETSLVLRGGEARAVLAADEHFFLLDETASHVRRADVAEVGNSDSLDGPPLDGIVQIETEAYRFDESGCAVSSEPIAERTEVAVLARSHDESYRGFVAISRDLTLIPVRAVDARDWAYPWHASVHLVKEVPEGFVIGGGVMLNESTLLTVRHLGVDETWCYSREPNSGVAWDSGLFTCDNIAGPAEARETVDVAIVTLLRPEAPPFATIKAEPLVGGEDFYTSNLSRLNTHAMSDSTVLSVGNSNGFCEPWPEGSTFLASDLVVGGGDSGGPAWVGDDLVGLVHGEACRFPYEPVRHVFIHLPALGL